MKDAIEFSVPIYEFGSGAKVKLALQVLSMADGFETGILQFARETMSMVKGLEPGLKVLPEYLAERIGIEAHDLILNVLQNPGVDFPPIEYPLDFDVPVVVDAGSHWLLWVGRIENEEVQLSSKPTMVFRKEEEGRLEWTRFLVNHLSIRFFSKPEFRQAFAEALNEEGWATQ